MVIWVIELWGAGEGSFVFWGTAESKGPVHTYSDSLKTPHSVPMQSHLISVVLCLISTYAWLGSKFFGTFTRIVVKVYNLCRVKTNRLAMLTVKSGLVPHMINKLKDGFKSFFGYFLWPCWVPTISVLTLTYPLFRGEQWGRVLQWLWWVLRMRCPSQVRVEVEDGDASSSYRLFELKTFESIVWV